MQSIFDKNTKEDLLKRIDNLSEDSQRQWGKMTHGQMVWHCQFPLKLGIKNKKEGNGNLFAKLLFKKGMYNDKPWRKNLPTAPALKTKEPKNLEAEKAILRQLVADFHECKTREEWNPHPIFGSFTHEQWGKMQYKHLNHHLTQFGV